jgi:phosphoribulokinase
MNTLVVPGGKMGLAMELIMTPLVQRLMEGSRSRDPFPLPVGEG